MKIGYEAQKKLVFNNVDAGIIIISIFLCSLRIVYKADTVKSADKPSALFVPTHNLESPGSTL